MNEDFLHFIWQNKLYHPYDLKTTDGEELEIIHPGIINTHSGPDFFNAKIKLSNTLWAGNIEIHTHESDWFNHKHHQDDSYNNVILHVVNKSNGETITASGRQIPVWEMKFSTQLTDQYQSLFFNNHWLPCKDYLDTIDPIFLSQWIDRILIERMEEKSELTHQLLLKNQNDWDQVFFILLARSFGFGVNGLPFEMLAQQTPLKVMLKHADNIFQTEAILLGQSGLLNATKKADDYSLQLQKEYTFLSHKYNLKPIRAQLWKFSKLRPSNFPTIRLAQLAMLIHQTKGLFETLLNQSSSKQFVQHLNINASEYWNTHYHLGKTSSPSTIKHLGKSSAQKILYNTIYPYLFVYFGKNKLQEKKENLLDSLYEEPAEKNSIITNWQQAGIKITNEAQAQALIFLKNHYCNHKKCLNCRIGHKVLSKA
nr:DUF2851 family protein [uncultured Carboxylicivirga sp.]